MNPKMYTSTKTKIAPIQRYLILLIHELTFIVMKLFYLLNTYFEEAVVLIAKTIASPTKAILDKQ